MGVLLTIVSIERADALPTTNIYMNNSTFDGLQQDYVGNVDGMTSPFKYKDSRDHFMYASSQWETTLHCNVVSHRMGAYTECSLGQYY